MAEAKYINMETYIKTLLDGKCLGSKLAPMFCLTVGECFS
jgi:hypothetical protein